ncbi:MAG: carbohydrate-binding domain-containing protein, partial [Ruminococcus sp.]|nr:carbohydrate-binding domain-containing protein [Ruminococcus sp.]
ISASEGIEGTYVQINGGTVNISARDDGINGSNKSSAVNLQIEINDGEINIDMAQGDTDGIDSNGDLYINGGTISINAQSTFYYDGNCEKNGGTIIVNGTETDTITNQMMGGGMNGGGMNDGGMNGGGMNRW